MGQRPKGLPNNCFYYDLADQTTYAETAELCADFAIRKTTIFVGSLADDLKLGNVIYRTAVIDVSGKVVLCSRTAVQLMTVYSQHNLLTCRLSRWLADELGLQNFPYFHGENSFIPDSSPQRQQAAWVCSRWYSTMRAYANAVLVTFSQADERQPKVVIRVQLSVRSLTTQLGLVREFLLALTNVVQQGFKELLPSSTCDLMVPANLPKLTALDIPQVQPAQLRQFIYDCFSEDVCQLAETEQMSVREATASADYHIRPPRGLKHRKSKTD